MVEVNNLTKTFMDDAGPLHVLKDTSFRIEKGEMVALIGVSGAGKTTLLQILGGLDRATVGKVSVDGKELNRMNVNNLARFRLKSIGFVFQFHHLLPDFTALENVIIPGLLRKEKKSICIKRAKELLSIMRLERQAHHYPSELSGGERQRAALARALFNEPALVLADEPTGNIDKENSRQLMELFHKTNKELNQTYLVATHNETLSENMHRTVFIEDGKIISKA
jgi:lipoprotein-releasing system ATP-binding protein